MWYSGRPAAEQCEGCTWCTTQVAELSYLHTRDITYAVFCQGPYAESIRYHDFMGWDMPVYRCYSSYARGTEFMMGHYAILDRTPKGRDEGNQPMSWLHRHDEYHNQ